MKTIIGILLILSGVFLGLYLGLWLLFIGGVVGCIEAIKATPVDSWGIAIGIAKIMVAGFVGWVSFLGLAGLGVGVMKS